MSAGEIYVTFVIPGFVLTAGYLPMLANERAVRRAVEREKREAGE